MKNSKFYYGGVSLDKNDLIETAINHKIELEYYGTKIYTAKEETTLYGIEVIKKEYKNEKTNIEKSDFPRVGKNANEIMEMMEILKRNKVTPITLHDIIEDLIKRKITE